MFCNARRICVTVGVFLVLATSAAMAEMLLGSNDKAIDVPAGWTEEQTVNAVYKAVSELATRAMPGCTIKRNFDGTDSLSIAWRVSEFQGYTVGMTANYPKNPRTYIGPVDDGLTLRVYFSPNADREQAVRPQILKKYGGVPWDTLLGDPADLKGLNTKISFNLSYGPKTSQELRKQFSDPYLWMSVAKNMSNSTQRHPAAPPTEKMFSNLTPQEIIQWFEQENPTEISKKLVWDGREKENERIYSGEAAAWFIWKTQDTKEGSALREKLADVILKPILDSGKQKQSLHCYAGGVGILKALEAKKQLDEIFKVVFETQPSYIDCCFTSALLSAWSEVAGQAGLPRLCLVMNIDKKGRFAKMVEHTLEKATGHKIPHKDGKPDQQAWLEYCENLQLQNP